jgi:hypothetical protein
VSAMRKVALAIVAFAALAALTLSGCETLLFSGGVGNIIRNHTPAPDVNGQALTRKRLEASEDLKAALAFLDAGTALASYATSTDDRCYKGENNAKITDGYAHRCTVRMTRFYGMSGDFRAQMIGVEDLLASAGWQMPRSISADLPPPTFREMFVQYYDVWCRGSHIAIFGSGVVAPTCEISKLPRSGSNGYRKGHLALWIECAERGESNLFMMDLMQKVPTGKEYSPEYILYEKTDVQDLKAVVEGITASHRYVISVTVQETYFEN